MEISNPKFKALAVTFGFSFWFFIISTSTGFFSFELFALFVIITTIITQILSKKLSSALDVFAIEPPQDKELLKLPNFIVTPHIGGSANEAILAMGRAAIDGLDCVNDE